MILKSTKVLPPSISSPISSFFFFLPFPLAYLLLIDHQAKLIYLRHSYVYRRTLSLSPTLSPTQSAKPLLQVLSLPFPFLVLVFFFFPVSPSPCPSSKFCSPLILKIIGEVIILVVGIAAKFNGAWGIFYKSIDIYLLVRYKR